MVTRNVLVVPGFMGSVLTRNITLGINKEVWYNRLELATGSFRYLRLAADGVSPGPGTDGVILSPAGEIPDWGSWTGVLEKLSAEGWNAHFFAYDWRKSLRDAAAAMEGYIRGNYVGQDYWVLAYSAGGLIARLCYAQMGQGAAVPGWKRTLFVGCPQYGSYDAAKALASPVQTLSLFGVLMTALNPAGATIIQEGVRALLNNQFRPIVSSWPALYELLPSISPPWDATRPLDATLYQAATYDPPNAAVSQHWLDQARVTRSLIDDAATRPEPPMRSVIGSNLDTSSLVIRASRLNEGGAYGTGPGDGTVTTERSTLTDAPTKLDMTDAIHTDLMGQQRLVSRITSLLLDDDPPPVTTDSLKPPVAPPQPPVGGNNLAGPGFPAIVRRDDP